MAGLRRYFFSDSPLRETLEGILGTVPGRTVSRVGQAPLGGSQVAEWDFESPASWRWHCGIVADDLSLDSEGQMRQIFEKYESLLAQEFMTVADHCFRTWIFVRDIDHNYAGVVKGRREYFQAIGLTPETHFIASTGIGGHAQDPSVLTQMDNYAVGGISQEQVHYLYAPSHMNRTSDYGVSFERGTYIDYGDRRHVFISGTASIDNKGQIVHPRNVERQTLRLWENVEALLQEADCTYEDASMMIVYLRDPADYLTVRRLYEGRFAGKPLVIVHAPVCRTGWLVEMEVMAVKDIDNKNFADL